MWQKPNPLVHFGLTNAWHVMPSPYFSGRLDKTNKAPWKKTQEMTISEITILCDYFRAETEVNRYLLQHGKTCLLILFQVSFGTVNHWCSLKWCLFQAKRMSHPQFRNKNRTFTKTHKGLWKQRKNWNTAFFLKGFIGQL